MGKGFFIAMPKTKEQKQAVIKGLEENFSKKVCVVLLNFASVNSKALFALRDKLKENNSKLEVVKKTLLEKVLKEKPELQEKVAQIKGQLAIAFGFGDEVETAKICYQAAKENENLQILGGILEDQFNEATVVNSLAQLPSRQELLAKVVSCLNAPMSGLANALGGNLRNFVFTLNEIQKVKV